MRLLIATGLFPPDIGGPATHTKLFEEQLPKYGIEVSVLPYSVVRSLPPILRHIAYAWLIARRIHSVDLVLTQDTVSTGLPAAIISWLAGKKLIVRVPGDYAWEQGVQRFGVKDSLDEFQQRSYGPMVGIFRLVQRFVVRRAYRIIVPSEYLGRIVARWIPSSKNIRIIHNGIDLTPTTFPVRASNVIISSGRLVPWKGFEALIDIVARHKDWKLEILGDGPQRSELQDRSWAASANERIAFHGSVPHTQVMEAFSKAAVFVLNSRYEGLSHTLIEAMAVGTPVIATHAGGNPEVVHNGVDGLLVNVGDTEALEKELEKLLSDEGLRQQLGAAAARRANDFSIEKTVAATALFLKSCITSEVVSKTTLS